MKLLEPPEVAEILKVTVQTLADWRCAGGPENDWQPYCPLPVLMKIMGHRKIETTMRYVKTTPEAAAKAMERYGAAIQAVTARSEAKC